MKNSVQTNVYLCIYIYISSTYLKVEFLGFRTQFFIFWRIANMFCKAVALFTFPSAIYEGFHSSHSWQYPCHSYITRVGMKLYLNVILTCCSWRNNTEIFPVAYWPFVCHLWKKNIYSNLFSFIFQLAYSYFYYWIMSYSYILNTSPLTDMIYKHFLPFYESLFPLVIIPGTQKF